MIKLNKKIEKLGNFLIFSKSDRNKNISVFKHPYDKKSNH